MNIPFEIDYPWVELSDDICAWGLNPADSNAIIELDVRPKETGSEFTILYRKYPNDGMQFTTLTTIKPVNSAELKELVRFLAYRITVNETNQNTHHPFREYGYVMPDNPSQKLQPILDFLERKYNDTPENMEVPIITASI